MLRGYCRILVTEEVQAAACDLTTSKPSENTTSWTTFGNWLGEADAS
jgi:hypothetical protein